MNLYKMLFLSDNYVFLAVAISYLARFGSIHNFVAAPIYFIFNMALYSAFCEWGVDLLIRPEVHPHIAAMIAGIGALIIYLRVTGRIEVVEIGNNSMAVHGS